MKIAFDLTALYDHLTGIERYNFNITKNIILQNPHEKYILIFKNEIYEPFIEISRWNNVKCEIIPSCNKFVFIQYRLLKVLNKINADYYVFLSFTSPVLFNKGKIINAIHDLTCWDCPETIPFKMKLYYRYTYKVACKKSWKIVTVSMFSQKRICEKYKLSEKDVLIIYDGLTDIFKENILDNPEMKEKYSIPNRYILSVSTIEPRKNLQLLIQAYSELIEEGNDLVDLVLAGRKGWKLEEITDNVPDTVKNKIHFTGFIDDCDLPQVYREADLFVFPSKYEGFGLPIIEALSQGTIVVSSDAASLPEVAGDLGIMFKSENKDDLKLKLLEAVKIKKDELFVEKAKKTARKYDWKKEANKLFEYLKDNY